jgi:hypothetical protein
MSLIFGGEASLIVELFPFVEAYSAPQTFLIFPGLYVKYLLIVIDIASSRG